MTGRPVYVTPICVCPACPGHRRACTNLGTNFGLCARCSTARVQEKPDPSPPPTLPGQLALLDENGNLIG